MENIPRIELIQVAEAVAREKLIDKEDVILAMEDAIQKAARSKYGLERDIRADIDRKNGSINIAQFTEVVEKIENEATQMTYQEAQRRNLDLMSNLNQMHLQCRLNQSQLEARMSSYELAFRMQMKVPGILDLEGENKKIRESYGIGKAKTDSFGRKCLLARRLVEKGVRFVQAYAGNWDSHDYISRAHGSLIQSVDQPISALLKDLKQRGLLEDTLVVWGGEFGRTPDNGLRGGSASYGRDHNAKAMTLWFAGGGTKAGHTIGATDEIGAEAVECVHPIRDVHVTWLHLLGLDDDKLTYYHAGRHKQLSQFGGNVIHELIA